jgi:hypothetical protein
MLDSGIDWPQTRLVGHFHRRAALEQGLQLQILFHYSSLFIIYSCRT